MFPLKNLARKGLKKFSLTTAEALWTPSVACTVRLYSRVVSQSNWPAITMFPSSTCILNFWSSLPAEKKITGYFIDSLCPSDVIWQHRYCSTMAQILACCLMAPSHYLTSSWRRHQMETFSTLKAICAVNSPVPGEFSAQRPEMRSFDVFFDLCLNKRLSKQSWDWWFELLSPHYDVIVMKQCWVGILDIHLSTISETIKHIF